MRHACRAGLPACPGGSQACPVQISAVLRQERGNDHRDGFNAVCCCVVLLFCCAGIPYHAHNCQGNVPPRTGGDRWAALGGGCAVHSCLSCGLITALVQRPAA
jgi:hypothetical protein